MTIFVDHAFVMCDIGAPEADVLRGLGFVEGSPNVHIGQGTANRRFFFDNFMLEMLWVNDPSEATSEAVRHTALWQRWSARHDGGSRFGLVLGGALRDGALPPFETQSYFPSYLPPELSIEVVQGLSLDEPALYWIPWLGANRNRPNEPVDHAAPVRHISELAYGLPKLDGLTLAARRVLEAGLLKFFPSNSLQMEIRFRAKQDCRIDLHPDLPLAFHGT
jgi:hypothetical protein